MDVDPDECLSSPSCLNLIHFLLQDLVGTRAFLCEHKLDDEFGITHGYGTYHACRLAEKRHARLENPSKMLLKWGESRRNPPDGIFGIYNCFAGVVEREFELLLDGDSEKYYPSGSVKDAAKNTILEACLSAGSVDERWASFHSARENEAYLRTLQHIAFLLRNRTPQDGGVREFYKGVDLPDCNAV
jgi:hypothetical protein